MKKNLLNILSVLVLVVVLAFAGTAAAGPVDDAMQKSNEALQKTIQQKLFLGQIKP